MFEHTITTATKVEQWSIADDGTVTLVTTSHPNPNRLLAALSPEQREQVQALLPKKEPRKTGYAASEYTMIDPEDGMLYSFVITTATTIRTWSLEQGGTWHRTVVNKNGEGMPKKESWRVRPGVIDTLAKYAPEIHKQVMELYVEPPKHKKTATARTGAKPVKKAAAPPKSAAARRPSPSAALAAKRAASATAAKSRRDPNGRPSK